MQQHLLAIRRDVEELIDQLALLRVARLDVGDLTADLFDYSGGFVTEHRGRRIRIEAVHEMEVAMTDAAGDGLDQDFAILRLVEFDVLDTEGQLGPMENCGFHSGCSLSAILW